ncbi:hypothetical protein ADN01_16680 [Levilinea saccharolytica]|nr:hypothetical protein ADN01_16680 [Levilinea saccharolytica]
MPGVFQPSSAASASSPLQLEGSSLGNWQTAPALNATREYFGTAATSNAIYVAGGQGQFDALTSVEFALQSGSTISTWNDTSPLNHEHYNPAMLAADSFLYVVGGSTDAVEVASINTDGSLGTWQDTTSLPQSRNTPGAAAYLGYLYVFGGMDDMGGKITDCIRAPIQGDGSLGSWEATTPLPEGRSVFAAAAQENRIYLIGGYGEDEDDTTTQVGAIQGDGSIVWSTTSAIPNMRIAAAATISNGRVYVMGGYNPSVGSAPLKTVISAAIQSDGNLSAWSTEPSLVTAREALGAASLGSSIYAIGGRTASGTIYKTVERASVGSAPPPPPTIIIHGAVRVPNAQRGQPALPLKNLKVDLIQDGHVFGSTTTKGGHGADAGEYQFEVPQDTAGNFRVRASLIQPHSSSPGLGGFTIHYMPPLLDDPLPYVETANFLVKKTEIRRDLEFSSSYLLSGGNTNLPLADMLNLNDLGYMFYHLEQAEDFTVQVLEANNLAPVIVEAFSDHGTAYYYSTNTITIFADDSTITSRNRPENREWHEYFHHVMFETNMTAHVTRDCGNHKGFLNSTTSDSWAEGWAVFWADALGEYVNQGTAGIYSGFLDLETQYTPWHTETGSDGSVLQREDVAVAAILYDLHDSPASDDDPFSLSFTDIKDLLLQKQAGGTYTQIDNMQQVYNILHETYGEDADKVFFWHGFFGDAGWTVSGCAVTSRGNRDWESGEDLGEGGRENRPNLPVVEGANLLLNLQSRTGFPLGEGDVQVTFLSPLGEQQYIRTFQLTAENQELLHLEPPPADIPILILVQGNDPTSPVFQMSNDEYWEQVAMTEEGYVQEITLTVKGHTLFLPLILR